MNSDEEDTEFGDCTVMIEDEVITASQQVRNTLLLPCKSPKNSNVQNVIMNFIKFLVDKNWKVNSIRKAVLLSSFHLAGGT